MKLSKRARTGLDKSIKKWEAIVEGLGEDRGNSNCALCQLYWDNDCESCPVYKKTGRPYCEGTPHEDWRNHHEKEHFHEPVLRVYCPTCKKLTNKELEFLKSLC